MINNTFRFDMLQGQQRIEYFGSFWNAAFFNDVVQEPPEQLLFNKEKVF